MLKPLAQQGRAAVVLVAEDDGDHAMLIRVAFGQVRMPVELHVVDDGDACLRFLRREGEHAQAPVPDLLLLDIHMPRMDGHEVLERIGADPALRSLPVVVLSTSANPGDVERMYRLRCSSFLAKPVDFAQFVAAIQQLADYWLGLVLLPRRSE